MSGDLGGLVRLDRGVGVAGGEEEPDLRAEFERKHMEVSSAARVGVGLGGGRTSVLWVARREVLFT